jgi:hypothetical protein
MGFGCQDVGVGDPCIPEDEYRVEFSGYSKDEVNVESRSFQCETRVCLVNKFQGRVSCPYGQDFETPDPMNPDAPLARIGERSCTTPDSTTAEPLYIAQSVEAQLEARRPKDAVYCSCRCNGPQSNAPYCECPNGFTCTDLIDDIGLGNKQLAGSYCVKNGTEMESKDILDKRCANGSCGPADQF